MAREVHYSEDTCIAYADTGAYCIGSETRPVGGAGWRGEQRTGDRSVIAFSFEPVRIAFEDDDPVVLGPPMLAAAPAGTCYTRQPVGNRSQRTVFIGVPSGRSDGGSARGVADSLGRTIRCRAVPVCPRALVRARALERAVFGLGRPVEPLEVEECAVRIIDQAIAGAYGGASRGARTIGCDATGRRLRDAVHAVAEQVCVDPAQRWSLAELADGVELSPGYLSRVFRGCMGCTLTRYLAVVRVMHAAERVGDERGALTRLAFGSGFSSHAHMTSTFARLTGMTPSELAAINTVDRREAIGHLASGK